MSKEDFFSEDGGAPVVVDRGGLPEVVGQAALSPGEKTVSPEKAKQLYGDIKTYQDMGAAERYYRGVLPEVSLGMVPFGAQKIFEALDGAAGTSLGDWNKGRELAMERAGTGTAESVGHGLGMAVTAALPVEELMFGAKAAGAAAKGAGILERLGIRAAEDGASLVAREGTHIAEKAIADAVAADAAASLGKGGALSRIMKGATADGVQGSLYAAGNHVADATIHDKEVTAASFLASAGGGFMLGFGLGGAGRGLAEGAGAAGNKVATKLEERGAESIAAKIGIQRDIVDVARKELSMAGEKEFTEKAITRAAMKNVAQADAEIVNGLSQITEKVSRDRMLGGMSIAGVNDVATVRALKALPDNIPVQELSKFITGSSDQARTVALTEIRNAIEASQNTAAAKILDSVQASSLKKSTSRTVLDALENATPRAAEKASGGIASALGDFAFATAVGAATNPIGGALGYTAARAARYVLNGPHVKEAMERMALTGELSAATRTATDTISKLVSTFSRSSSMSLSKRSSMDTPTPKAYKKIVEEYNRVSSPQYRATVSQRVGKLSATPEMHEAFMGNYDRSVAAMGQRITAANTSQIGSMRKSYESSVLTRDQLNVVRTWNIIHNPMGAIKALMSGELSRDEAKTFREIWNPLYKELTKKVRESVAMSQIGGKGMSASKIVELSLVLGEPMDRIMEPEFIQRNQEAYAEAKVQEEQRASQQAPAGKAGITESPYATPTESSQ